MATSNTTTLDPILQDMYVPGLRAHFYRETPLFKRVEKVTAKHRFNGRKAVIAAITGRNHNYGYRAEGAALPQAQRTRIQNMEEDMRYGYAQIKLSGQIMAATRGGARAFADALQLEMSEAKKNVGWHNAKLVVGGDGTGALCQANGAGAATTTLVVDNPGVTYLEAEMYIDIVDSNGNVEASNVQISSITVSTNTVTLATASTWSNNSYVYIHGERNAVPMGLKGIIDDGSYVASFQNLSRSANPWLKANKLGNSGTNRPMTLRLVDDLCLEAEKNGGGGYPSALYSRHAHAQTYADLCRADKRYTPETKTFDGGWKAVMVTHPGGECPWFMDRFVQPNTVLAPQEDDIKHYVLEELDWWKPDGNITRPAQDGTDAIQATLRVYHNLVAHRCSGHSYLADLAES